MFQTVRQLSELMQPADGQPYIGSVDVGGEYYGTGDGSGKAFWPGSYMFSANISFPLAFS